MGLPDFIPKASSGPPIIVLVLVLVLGECSSRAWRGEAIKEVRSPLTLGRGFRMTQVFPEGAGSGPAK
jgi:hypothetical protein